jgi:DNA-binding transcriptional LysR family regulator
MNDSLMCSSMAARGLGLAYAFEPMVMEQPRTGRLHRVLARFAATVAGFFLYFPSLAQCSPSLRLFVEVSRPWHALTARRRLLALASDRAHLDPVTPPITR